MVKKLLMRINETNSCLWNHSDFGSNGEFLFIRKRKKDDMELREKEVEYVIGKPKKKSGESDEAVVKLRS